VAVGEAVADGGMVGGTTAADVGVAVGVSVPVGDGGAVVAVASCGPGVSVAWGVDWAAIGPPKTEIPQTSGV